MENHNIAIASNHIGPEGKASDRIYGSPAGGSEITLIQSDYTQYSGKIHKKQLIQKGMDGNNFKSHCFVTDDGRWFDRAGIPMMAPNNVVEEEDDSEASDG